MLAIISKMSPSVFTIVSRKSQFLDHETCCLILQKEKQSQRILNKEEKNSSIFQTVWASFAEKLKRIKIDVTSPSLPLGYGFEFIFNLSFSTLCSKLRSIH